MPQSTILSRNILSDDCLLINHLILIYKFYIYNFRNRGCLNIEHLKAIINKLKGLRKKLANMNLKKDEYLMKWPPFIDDLV